MLPNPLGLYDMLGNVEQWVLDPYRLNRVGRLQGMPGGLVARGGSYATPIEELRTSMRAEIPPVRCGEKRADTARLRRLPGRALDRRGRRAARGRGAAASFRGLAATERNRRPRSPGGRRAAQAADARPGVAPRARQPERGLASDERARIDAAHQALRAELNAATALCYVIWRVQALVALQQSQLSNPQFQDSQSHMLARLKAASPPTRPSSRPPSTRTASCCDRQSRAAGQGEIAAQAQVVTQEMAARTDRRRRFVEVAAKHLASLGGGHPVTPEEMLKDIVAVPRQ